MRKLLAITPYLGRTGSEIALLNLLTSLTDEFQIDVVTPNKAPELASEINKPIRLLKPVAQKQGLKQKIQRKIGIGDSIVKRSFLGRFPLYEAYDVVVLNTLKTLVYFPEAITKGKKIIVYIHETEAMLTGISAHLFATVIDKADLIICSSEHVRSYFKTMGRTSKVEVLHPTLDYSKFALPQSNKNLRASLGYKETDFVWGMAGTITVNKNPKMFIDIAKQVNEKKPNAKFMWIGYKGDSAYEDYLKSLVKEWNLEHVVTFITGKNEEYYEYINAINGFLLTSLSESFSLVSLEAACFGKPVVSFPCGGVIEAVPEVCLTVTKEFSVSEIASEIINIMNQDTPQFSFKTCNELVAHSKTEVSEAFTTLLLKHNLL